MQTRMIEIDFEVHQTIEAARQSFSETPLEVLRRLLGLGITKSDVRAEATATNDGIAWHDGGISVPHGTLARMSYRRGTQRFEGAFLNGALVVGDQSFGSLSEAASSLAKTKDGKSPTLNGWNYWEVKLPGSEVWQTADSMRKKNAAY